MFISRGDIGVSQNLLNHLIENSESVQVRGKSTPERIPAMPIQGQPSLGWSNDVGGEGYSTQEHAAPGVFSQ